MRFIPAAHWLIPWPIVIVGLMALVRFTRGYLDEKPFTDSDRRLLSVFRVLIGVQGLVGLIYFVLEYMDGEGLPLYRIGHAVCMLIAAMFPLIAMRRESITQNNIQLHYFYYLLASLLVMVVGVAMVPM